MRVTVGSLGFASDRTHTCGPRRTSGGLRAWPGRCPPDELGGENGMHAAIYAAITLPRITSLGWGRQLHHYVPVGLGGAISWTVWLTRFTLSRVYRPVQTGYTATTSVVVPAYREDPDILDRCLESWLRENPTEGIIVPGVADTEVIARLRRRADSEPR